MVGPAPKNAFDMRTMKGCHFELTPIGVYAKVKSKNEKGEWCWEEHVIPYANVQSIKLMSPADASLFEAQEKQIKEQEELLEKSQVV